MKTKIVSLLTLLILSTSCSKNEAEYYGYARKTEENTTKKIELSNSEQISNWIQNDSWTELNEALVLGLSVNKVLDNGRTLLNESVMWEREAIFKNLIQMGADPKLKDKTGVDTQEMCSEKINFLVLLDPNLLPKFQDELFSYLETEDNDEIKRLLEQKLNPNFFFASGETPLTYAITNNLENSVRTLLNPTFKADVHLKDRSGKTPLNIAQELKLKRIEKILMGRGAQF